MSGPGSVSVGEQITVTPLELTGKAPMAEARLDGLPHTMT